MDFEEEYQLISSAKVKNDKNIEDAIASLKVLGTPKSKPQQQNRVIKIQPKQEEASSNTIQAVETGDNTSVTKGRWE